jgi:NAD(P)-dependent dehydrogenase (short-subunit alcohol dehydrogenase family)
VTRSNSARSTPPRALIATLGAGSLDKLAAVLTGQGWRVAVLLQGDGKSMADESQAAGRAASDSCQIFHWDASSKEATQRSVDAVLARAGEPSQFIVHALPQAAVINRTVVEHDDVQWQAACGMAMLQTIHLLQCLGPALKTQRASIVFVGASLGLVGAERLAGLVTLYETQRGLMKSLARQWGGHHGVTCNWACLDARELWPGFTHFKLPLRLEAIPVALGRRPDAAADLAGALEYLASPAGRAVTGATLCLDGGEWMVP